MWKKNTVPAEKNKLKSTDYKTREQGRSLLLLGIILVRMPTTPLLS
jgi:hypothetical protein